MIGISVPMELAYRIFHVVCAFCMHSIMPRKYSDGYKIAIDCFLEIVAQLPYESH
jgi:hypothetical protein